MYMEPLLYIPSTYTERSYANFCHLMQSKVTPSICLNILYVFQLMLNLIYRVCFYMQNQPYSPYLTAFDLCIQ